MTKVYFLELVDCYTNTGETSTLNAWAFDTAEKRKNFVERYELPVGTTGIHGDYMEYWFSEWDLTLNDERGVRADEQNQLDIEIKE